MKRKYSINPGIVYGGLACLSLLPAFNPINAGEKPKMNVLFIAVDDLKPLLGCYGDTIVKSPNIDNLAKQGLIFSHAYCQQAVSSPSRISLLTGMRPDHTKVWDNRTSFRPALPNHVTLPQLFKNNGYIAQSYGKIYHVGDDQSWSNNPWHPNKPAFLTPEGIEEVAKNKRKEFNGIPWEAPDVADNALKDGETADEAINALRRLQDKPFFLAVGFVKPHLPYVAPKKYWDLYKQTQFKLPVNNMLPEGTPQYSVGEYEELKDYLIKSKDWPVADEEAKKLMHGYYACVSYIDTQIGKLIGELERLGLRENTVIILWGDHGYHHGEQNHWAKGTNFETSTRAPLIIRVPGQKIRGKMSEGLVEFIDIYPSLSDICGLKIPEGLDGKSFKPLIENPSRKWKRSAFSQYPRLIPNVGMGMGYSMRTERYRLTKWTVPGTDFCEYELYDYKVDPLETINYAGKPDYKPVVKRLINQFEKTIK